MRLTLSVGTRGPGGSGVGWWVVRGQIGDIIYSTIVTVKGRRERERAMVGLGAGRVIELLLGSVSPQISEGTPAFTVMTARFQLSYEATSCLGRDPQIRGI